jgi:hypothetical protein
LAERAGPKEEVAMDKGAVRKLFDCVRDVINREWNPIGVPDLPADEYDSYVGPIASMILHRSNDEALLRYMKWVEVEQMGLSPFDHDKAVKVIAILRNIELAD